MSRRAKYSKEFKLEIVRRYLKGESNISLCNEYNIPYNNGQPILKWVKKYEALGEAAFKNNKINKSYSKELKQQATDDYLNGRDSLEKPANEYKISTPKIVKRWF